MQTQAHALISMQYVSEDGAGLSLVPLQNVVWRIWLVRCRPMVQDCLCANREAGRVACVVDAVGWFDKDQRRAFANASACAYKINTQPLRAGRPDVC